MCLYSKIVVNKKYVANKKNGGIIPPFKDIRTTVVPIKCGKCKECRKQKKRDWQIRLLEEIKLKAKGHFVTLTLSNEHWNTINEYPEINEKKGYEKDNAIASKAVDMFNERWRKEFKKYPRHWLITELGHKGTERIHLHGIIWTNEPKETIKKHWKSFIWAGYENKPTYLSARTINYMIKYVTKQDEKNKTYIPKIFASKGIGKNYIQREAGKREYYKTETGHKIALPTYYRNKIYSDEEKEELWIKKLDEKIRYVDGYKIDISKGEKEYYKALKHAQWKAKKDGYGSPDDWKESEYEKQRRILKQNEIIGSRQEKT